jgi:2'-hydroxyisoflavone reductase
MTTRRDFLKASAAVGGAIGLGALPALGFAETLPARDAGRATKPLRILILGGTGFTGPEQVEYAIARGHSVTLINRNKTRPDFFKGRVEQLIGDLNADMSALKGLKFDVVIDNPTTLPGWVRNVAQYMKDNTDHYIFISTISAYANDKTAWADESDATHPEPTTVDPFALDPTMAGRLYGPLKATSEREVQKIYANKFTIIRPGLIVGPLDRSDRFTYWPYRIDKGGEVLAPGGKEPVQIIDSRDIAEWTIRMAENRTLGIFNATGPKQPYTMQSMLEGIRSGIKSNATFTWVTPEFLSENKVRAWTTSPNAVALGSMPVWVPDVPERAAWSRRKIDKALAAGLTFRPLEVTARETLAWTKTRPAAELEALSQGKLAGMSAEREAELLKLWKAKQAGSI